MMTDMESDSMMTTTMAPDSMDDMEPGMMMDEDSQNDDDNEISQPSFLMNHQTQMGRNGQSGMAGSQSFRSANSQPSNDRASKQGMWPWMNRNGPQ